MIGVTFIFPSYAYKVTLLYIMDALRQWFPNFLGQHPFILLKLVETSKRAFAYVTYSSDCLPYQKLKVRNLLNSQLLTHYRITVINLYVRINNAIFMEISFFKKTKNYVFPVRRVSFCYILKNLCIVCVVEDSWADSGLCRESSVCCL